MDQSNSKLSNILDELLQRISSGDVPVEVVSPSLLDDVSPKHKQCIIVCDEISYNEQLSCMGGKNQILGWDVNVSVLCIMRQRSDSTIPLDIACYNFAGEVLNTITEPTDWYRMGDLAINTTIQSLDKDLENDGSYATTNINLLIQFRTNELDFFN